jgi:ribonuclease E
MLDNEEAAGGTTPADTTDSTSPTDSTTAAPARRRRAPAKKTAASAPEAPPAAAELPGAPPAEAPVAKPARKRAAKKVATAPETAADQPSDGGTAAPAAAAPAKRARGRAKAATAAAASDGGDAPAGASEPAHPVGAAIPTVLFQAPEASAAAAAASHAGESTDSEESAGGGSRRGRRRGGRNRRGHGDEQAGHEQHDGAGQAGAGDADLASSEPSQHGTGEGDHDGDDGGDGSSRRRRRRRRRGSGGDGDEHAPDDPPNTVVRIREPREHDERGGGVQGVKGSTRLEAKKQRRREGREQIRRGRRGLVITEAEFLARRESVERVMVVRQRGERTQIGVLEDGILVEHFVSTASANRMVGNVYLGRVQNVLPGMEAAFVDIGKGRNAVLYAGEVNFDMSGMEGQPRRIESALKSGQTVLVQVTKDPIGHKGARLTSQVSLPGRYLVYVPEGSMMGISRKLPDVERSRLKSILKQVMPEGAGVIVRTAAEGASEEELARDVARLSAQWEDIQKKAQTGSVQAPALLYGEPDLTIRVIRDIFNEDFNSLVVQADSEWDTVEAYVQHVAPDLVPRLSRWTSEEDLFGHYRIDEQIAKALDRKVWLPSGGYLIIDRTEAMIVIDVNTGRFIGKGGNLEETVTKNNLEAAEEIVRQLRLRDIGGIIVIDFIDMVLESNRELVLRRLVECLGRDRTKHQVAEVTSLGLVQMTRKRVGTGLLEAFSEVCETCNGRGVIVHTEPVQQRPQRPSAPPKPAPPGGRQAGGNGGKDGRGAKDNGAKDNGARDNGGRDNGGKDNGGDSDTAAASNGSRTRRGGRRRGGAKAAAVETAATDAATASEPATVTVPETATIEPA